MCISVKCFPYHTGRSLIMGDAAHAMVPFYGQGMNCGMEDCLVLEDSLTQSGGDILAALEIYSKTRNPDAEAMCDLAMYNYIEVIMEDDLMLLVWQSFSLLIKTNIGN